MIYKNVLEKLNSGDLLDMIVIEGVVGCGKTTLLEELSKEGYQPFPEPVIDNPILDKFYYDRKRYAFLLQIFFLNKRFEHIKSAAQQHKSVLDRSIYGDVIFAKMLKDSGDMTEDEFNTYKDLLENMLQHCYPPKLMVYLEVSVDEAIRRIQRRGRDYEQIVPRQYWEDLNRNYREYFEHYNYSPLLKINIDNLNFKDNPKDREYIVGLILNAIKNNTEVFR